MKGYTEANAEAKKMIESLDINMVNAEGPAQIAEALDAHRVDLVIMFLKIYQAGRTDGIREANS